MICRRDFIKLFGLTSVALMVSPWNKLEAYNNGFSHHQMGNQPPRIHYGNRFGCSGLLPSEENLFFDSKY